MKKTFTTSICLLFSILAYSQNAPWYLWGTGLDGSVYQKAGFYSDAQNGLLIEAPLFPNGTKASIELNWRGGGVSPFKIAPNGNVGIGTPTPGSKLYVAGGGRNGIMLDGTLDGTDAGKYLSIWQGTGAAVLDPIGTGKMYLGYDQPTDIYFGGSTPKSIWKANGFVGVGTLTPSEMLSVNGKIRAKEIKVETINWPDYVFHSSYQLPDLKATEQFIAENKHLPEMPSAAEVEKDGINLGEMNAKLLKKIEELTLHLIEQNKLNCEQSKRIENLEKLIKR